MSIIDEMLYAAILRSGHRPALQHPDPFETAEGFRKTLPGIRSALALVYIRRKRALLTEQWIARAGAPVLTGEALLRALTRCPQPRPRRSGRVLTSMWLGLILAAVVGAGLYELYTRRASERVELALSRIIPHISDLMLAKTIDQTLLRHAKATPDPLKTRVDATLQIEKIDGLYERDWDLVFAWVPADDALWDALVQVLENLSRPKDVAATALARVNDRLETLQLPYYLDTLALHGECRNFVPNVLTAPPLNSPGGHHCHAFMMLAYRLDGSYHVRVGSSGHTVTTLTRLDTARVREPWLGKTDAGRAVVYHERIREYAEDMTLAALASAARDSAFPLGLSFDTRMQEHIGSLLEQSIKPTTEDERLARHAAQEISRSSQRLLAAKTRRTALRLADHGPAGPLSGQDYDVLSTMVFDSASSAASLHAEEQAALVRVTERLARRIEHSVALHQGVHLMQRADPPSHDGVASWPLLVGRETSVSGLAQEAQAHLHELLACDEICPLLLVALYGSAVSPLAGESLEGLVAQGLLATLALDQPPSSLHELADCTAHFVAVSELASDELHARAHHTYEVLFGVPPVATSVSEQ